MPAAADWIVWRLRAPWSGPASSHGGAVRVHGRVLDAAEVRRPPLLSPVRHRVGRHQRHRRIAGRLRLRLDALERQRAIERRRRRVAREVRPRRVLGHARARGRPLVVDARRRERRVQVEVDGFVIRGRFPHVRRRRRRRRPDARADRRRRQVLVVVLGVGVRRDRLRRAGRLRLPRVRIEPLLEPPVLLLLLLLLLPVLPRRLRRRREAACRSQLRRVVVAAGRRGGGLGGQRTG